MAERIQNTSPHIQWTASSHLTGTALLRLETKLTPYLTLGGIDYYSPTLRPGLGTPSDTINDQSSPDPIYRFAVGVVPLQDIDAPNDGSNKWLLNLDSEQLYTGPRSSSTDKGFWFGEKYVSGSSGAGACFEKYGSGDGAYASPTPVLGAPVEFRKIYFRGQPVTAEGKPKGCPEDPSGEGAINTYYAYFACSQPVQQDCVGSGVSDSGCAYNPRNETYGIQEGILANWEDFDIGGGGGVNDINFESSGCLPSPTVDTVTSTVTYSLTRDDILSCLGYTEQCVGLCIDGSIISGCILFDSGEALCCSG